MLAQRFIDTGPLVNHHRVLTLFGAVLLAFNHGGDGAESAAHFSWTTYWPRSC